MRLTSHLARLEWQSLFRAVLVALLALALTGVAKADTGPEVGELVEKAPVLITFPDLPGKKEQALVRAVGGEVKYTYRLVPAIAASVPEPALARLLLDPLVLRIEPDLVVQIAGHSAELDDTWGVAHIGAGDAHHQGYLGTGVRTAVLDTGITTGHQDLGYDPACSHSTSYSSINDGQGHGTHISGTIAARQNSKGVVGVAPEAQLCVYKVLSDSGTGQISDVIKALELILEYNEDNPGDPIRVANHSFIIRNDPGPTLKAAYDNAYDTGVLHVAPAGNDGNSSGAGDMCWFPARWDSVIAMAATTSNDSRLSSSSTCPMLELSAPGESINSTEPGGYAMMSGTSVAAPHVSGTAALAWDANPSLTHLAVRDILRDTSKNLGARHHFGFGLVQAEAAANKAASMAPPVLVSITVNPSEATIDEGHTHRFTARGRFSDGSARDMTAQATWASDNKNVATMHGHGLARGVSEGMTTIRAKVDGMEDTATLKVTRPGPGPRSEIVTKSVAVRASSDDAFAGVNPGWPGYRSTTHGIYSGAPGSNGPAAGGWRFTGLDIPANAKIIEAFVELNQHAWGYDVTTTLTLENSAAPATFSAASTPAHRLRNRTAFETSWTFNSARPGTWFQTPSLASGLQELVNTHGAIQDIVLLEEGSGRSPGKYHYWAAFDDSSTVAAQLIVTYSVPGAGPTPTPEPTPGPGTVTKAVAVNASSDDAFAGINSGWPGYRSTSPGIYAGAPGSNGPVAGGWRFTGLDIPAGATINEAFVRLNQWHWGYDVTTTLTFEDSAAPATFSPASTPADRLRNRTGFGTRWAWESDRPGAWFQTPSLAAGLQELVDNHGAIQSVVLLEDGTGVPERTYHYWAAFDDKSTVAAQLVVTYSTK